MKIDDLPKRYRDQARAKIASADRPAIPAPDVERVACDGALETKEGTRFRTPVSLHVHSKRESLCDADGVSAKAAIDGLVEAGLFADDSTKFVKNVSYSQEKCAIEETVIEIWST